MEVMKQMTSVNGTAAPQALQSAVQLWSLLIADMNRRRQGRGQSSGTQSPWSLQVCLIASKAAPEIQTRALPHPCQCMFTAAARGDAEGSECLAPGQGWGAVGTAGCGEGGRDALLLCSPCQPKVVEQMLRFPWCLVISGAVSGMLLLLYCMV